MPLARTTHGSFPKINPAALMSPEMLAQKQAEEAKADEIIQASENPVPTIAPVPKGFSNRSPIELRVRLLERALEGYDLDNVGSITAADAEKVEGLIRQYEAAKKLLSEKEADAEFKIRNLKEIESKLELEAYSQAACERMMHQHNQADPPSIGGQLDSNHEFVGTCMICGKNFKGVGNLPGQVPSHIWARMDQNNIGG